MREKNIKLNSEKCTFNEQEVTYMGHILTAEGIKPDTKKVEAVRKTQKPTNKTELQIYLGIAWESGTVPKEWQTGVVVPLFKKGGPESVCQLPGYHTSQPRW